MIRKLIVYINSDRSVFPKELKIANQFEIKTNEIKFIFDGDIPRTGYPYLILTNRNGSFYLPLVDDSVVFGSQETWIMGGWSAHIMISQAEIINGIVNKSEKLFISDDFGLWLEPSDINIDDLKEQQIPTPLKLLYDDLFALKERVEEILDGGLSDGKDGVDGVSPTVSVSKSGKVTTITINDVEGTKTATINDGLDGKDGSNGQNGKDGTSVTVSNVSESTADGGSNVVTFSDGKSITIKNGSKGSKGDSGQDGADGHTPVKGVDYFDGQNGKDGQDGKDGVSISSVTQTTTSSEDGGTNIVQVTLSNGNKSSFQVKNGSKGSKGDKGNPGDAGYTPVKGVDYFDGVDGKDGQNGSNGKDGTSVTVKSVSESTADGGSNVVTFSDGKTVTIKNGSKGSKGDKGDTGPTGPAYTLTASDKAAITASVKSEIDPELDELKESISDYETLTLGVHSDGKIYIFKNGSPIGSGVEAGSDGDVVGYIDSNNNIVLTGALADDTYTVKYEMDNGTLINIGNLSLVATVTNNLTYCTNGNSATDVSIGGSYSATISANSGYELKSITVTMGGTDVTSSAVNGNTITISEVTGNIVITAVAEEIVVAEPVTVNITLTDGIRIGSDGGDRTQVGYCATPHIDLTNIPKPCTIHLTKALWCHTSTQTSGMVRVYAKKADGTQLVSDTTRTNVGGNYFTVVDNSNDIGNNVTVTVKSNDVGYIRFSGGWTIKATSDSDVSFAQANTKATLTYTPKS